MTFSIRFLGPVLLSLTSTATFAQVDDQRAALVEAFSGEWFNFDARGEGGEPCVVTLSEEGDRPFPATSASCDTSISQVEAWDIADGQILLLDGPAGAVIARLGGNQFRISGETNGNGFAVLERSQGDPNSQAVRQAISTYRCIYRGFTDDCASRAELQVPEFVDGEPARVKMLVNLNVRQQPRADSGLVGMIETGSVVTLQECLVTSDGPWCAARFGDEIGWLARTTLRLDTWPVMTFTQVD